MCENVLELGWKWLIYSQLSCLQLVSCVFQSILCGIDKNCQRIGQELDINMRIVMEFTCVVVKTCKNVQKWVGNGQNWVGNGLELNINMRIVMEFTCVVVKTCKNVKKWVGNEQNWVGNGQLTWFSWMYIEFPYFQITLDKLVMVF